MDKKIIAILRWNILRFASTFQLIPGSWALPFSPELFMHLIQSNDIRSGLDIGYILEQYFKTLNQTMSVVRWIGNTRHYSS